MEVHLDVPSRTHTIRKLSPLRAHRTQGHMPLHPTTSVEVIMAFPKCDYHVVSRLPPFYFSPPFHLLNQSDNYRVHYVLVSLVTLDFGPLYLLHPSSVRGIMRHTVY